MQKRSGRVAAGVFGPRQQKQQSNFGDPLEDAGGPFLVSILDCSNRLDAWKLSRLLVDPDQLFAS